VGYAACMGKLITHSFSLGNPKGKPFGRPTHRRVDNTKTNLQETGWQTWIGLIWLRTGTCDWLLQTWRIFGFDKMWRVCQLAKELLASQEGLYSMELSSQSVGYLSLDI